MEKTERVHAVTCRGMPSPRHDALNLLFTEDPRFAIEVLRDLLGVNIPVSGPVQVGQNQLNDRPSTDFHPDSVITVGAPQDPVHGIIVEIQQSATEGKRRQLPRYAAALWLMLSCPVTVLVVCPSAKTAAWYTEPISTDLPGFVFKATVLGPDDIPLLSEPKQVVAQPKLAALAVMAHGNRKEVIETFLDGLQHLTRDYALYYYEHVHSLAAPPVRRILEEFMVSKTPVLSSNFAREHFSRGVAEGEAKGEARGEAKAVLLTLAARGVEVSGEARSRIAGCEDLDQLEVWVRRAATAESIDDLFR
jgi:hypothetical protein